jgi:hypothetical protein
MTILKTMLLRPITEIFNISSSGAFYYQRALSKFYGISQKTEFRVRYFRMLLFSVCKFMFPIIE